MSQPDPFAVILLPTLLTSESVVFGLLSVAVALSASTPLGRRGRPRASTIANCGTALVGILAVGATGAWYRLFLRHGWPVDAALKVAAGSLIVGILLEPSIALAVAINMRSSRSDRVAT
jgi:hypothetical protein